MPSIKKILHFISSALVTSVAVALLVFAMTDSWSTISLDCSRPGNATNDGSAAVGLMLFEVAIVRVSCPTFGGTDSFEVFPTLMEIEGPYATLHGLVLGLLALCLLCSAGSILISLYNSVSNPYETYMGPVGIYVCSSISACVALLVIIVFVVNVLATNMPEELVKYSVQGLQMELTNKTAEMLVGFYLVIPYIVLSLGAIVLIYLYDHAAYTHRREQQKPTEDAPKEIMMY
ncbi:clarin-3 [Halichoeres trimaculatus]|uniref:clarin-3 n=1 Tax=Halichoeres trimaculatus TaxID=147232 RepID=UPI003D9E3CD5